MWGVILGWCFSRIKVLIVIIWDILYGKVWWWFDGCWLKWFGRVCGVIGGLGVILSGCSMVIWDVRKLLWLWWFIIWCVVCMWCCVVVRFGGYWRRWWWWKWFEVMWVVSGKWDVRIEFCCGVMIGGCWMVGFVVGMNEVDCKYFMVCLLGWCWIDGWIILKNVCLLLILFCM